MASNGISTLTYKRDRQVAKLDLAADNREISGRRRYYVLDQLPSTYADSDNDTRNRVDTANTGGLIVGRPWTAAYSDGLYLQPYTGYFADDPTWFATASTTGTASTPETFNTASIPTTTSWQYLGYFRAPDTGTFTFYISSDDASYLWVGATAVSGFTTGNALAKNPGEHPVEEDSGTIALEDGELYAIRIQVGNNAAGGSIKFEFAGPGIARTFTFTDLVIHNSDSQGL